MLKLFLTEIDFDFSVHINTYRGEIVCFINIVKPMLLFEAIFIEFDIAASRSFQLHNIKVSLGQFLHLCGLKLVLRLGGFQVLVS
jgi:hypothetical protein